MECVQQSRRQNRGAVHESEKRVRNYRLRADAKLELGARRRALQNNTNANHYPNNPNTTSLQSNTSSLLLLKARRYRR
jgi:hypothetical protein